MTNWSEKGFDLCEYLAIALGSGCTSLPGLVLLLSLWKGNQNLERESVCTAGNKFKLQLNQIPWQYPVDQPFHHWEENLFLARGHLAAMPPFP